MIQNVMSFMGAWSSVQSINHDELTSLSRAIRRYASGEVEKEDEEGGRVLPRILWARALKEEGWTGADRRMYGALGMINDVRFIGPQKNGLGASIANGNPDFLSRWLFSYATRAVRNGVLSIPILVVPMRDSVSDDHRYSSGTFESYREQLEMLSPISLGVPFLIIGYSAQDSLFEMHVLELEKDEMLSDGEPNFVVNKSIEFPSEYHQAGVGILNYFSTYLNENYPAQNATVRIEQNGLKVKMIVISDDGNSEIIEQALHEYEQIMTGKENANKFTQNEKLVLEMRNEIRIAKFRIESQQDIIALQSDKLKTSEDRIDTLLCLVGESLKKETHPISIQVNPQILNSVSNTSDTDISSSMGILDEMSNIMPEQDEVKLPIFDLTKSLQRLESEQNPAVVKSSSAMKKFKRFIDNLSNTNSTIRKTLDTTQNGYDIALELVEKYNKIASWCGLPSVPTFK